MGRLVLRQDEHGVEGVNDERWRTRQDVASKLMKTRLSRKQRASAIASGENGADGLRDCRPTVRWLRGDYNDDIHTCRCWLHDVIPLAPVRHVCSLVTSCDLVASRRVASPSPALARSIDHRRRPLHLRGTPSRPTDRATERASERNRCGADWRWVCAAGGRVLS